VPQRFTKHAGKLGLDQKQKPEPAQMIPQILTIHDQKQLFSSTQNDLHGSGNFMSLSTPKNFENELKPEGPFK
jgi:hypothetical protein